MRFLGMPVTVANHLRVLDVLEQLDYSGFPFWKSQSRSSFLLGEYGIRRILFHFQANRRSSPQSTHIRSPDKTQHIRITALLLYLLGFVPPHPGIFCNTASDHLITDYAANRVLQQERFCTSSAAPVGRRKNLFKSFENFSIFSISRTLYSENCYFVHRVLSYYGSEYGSNGFLQNRMIFLRTFRHLKRNHNHA